MKKTYEVYWTFAFAEDIIECAQTCESEEEAMLKLSDVIASTNMLGLMKFLVESDVREIK